MLLDAATDNLIAAKGPWLSVSPGIGSVIAHKTAKHVFIYGKMGFHALRSRKHGTPWRQVAVNNAAGPLVARASRPYMRPITQRISIEYMKASVDVPIDLLEGCPTPREILLAHGLILPADINS